MPVITAQACALLGVSEKAYIDGIIAKREHRYVVAKEYFEKVDPNNRAFPLAQEEAALVEGILNELRRAQRDAEIAYKQERWVAAYVNYQIIAKYQPWNKEAQARVDELRQKAKMDEVIVATAAPKNSQPQPAIAPVSKSPAAPVQQNKPSAAKTTATAAEPVPPQPSAALPEVADGKKDEIDEKLRVYRQLARLGQHQQIIELLASVVDEKYRQNEIIDAYVPSLLEVAQKFYTNTEYGKALKLFKEAYRVKADPNIAKLLERTQKLVSALEGGS